MTLPAIPPKQPEFTPTDYDLMIAAVVDIIADGIPLRAVWDLTYLAQDPMQFYTGMMAAAELNDVVKDHYAEETDYGTSEETDGFENYIWWPEEPDDGLFDEIADD